MAEPIIDPGKIQALIAGGFGGFLSVLFQRDSSKLKIFTTLATAEIVDYYFANPLWAVFHDHFAWADAQWQGPVAFSIGLLAIFAVGAIIKLASEFMAAPMKTISDLAVSILGRFFQKKGD